MVKRSGFQENRRTWRRKGRDPRERWVFQPMDLALAFVVVAILFWLQWLLTVLPA